MEYFWLEDIRFAIADLVEDLCKESKDITNNPIHIIFEEDEITDSGILRFINYVNEYENYTIEIKKICCKIGGLLLFTPKKYRIIFMAKAWKKANESHLEQSS